MAKIRGANLNGTPRASNFLAELKKTIAENKSKEANTLKSAEQVLKLGLCGVSVPEIVELTGVDKTSVKSFTASIKNVLTNFDPNKLLGYTENTISILKSLEAEMLQHLCCPDKLAKAPLNQVAYSFEVLHKARRLEEGKSTENHSNLITIQGEKYK
jgi:hypothetical protein